MKYREILEKRNNLRIKIEELISIRNLTDKHFELNEEITNLKKQYEFYNKLLKTFSNKENK